MEIFVIVLTFLLLKNVLSENAWEIQNKASVKLREKVEKTKIVAYSKAKMTNNEIKNEKMRIENVCQCKVENLESVGSFILTYNNPSRRAAVSLNLDPSKMAAADDQLVHISDDETPGQFLNDPDFNKQWPLHDLANNADINAAEGWREYLSDDKGGDPNGPSVVVAVVDTGVDINHQDLKDVMWTNPGEVPDNGQDDDGNAIIDDVHGADFVNEDGDPDDEYVHGTHCAGIIAAKENNDKGIAGVASFTQGKVKIMAVKGCNKYGKCPISDLIKGLNYAIYNGATISSCSWGKDMNASTLPLFKLYLQNNPKHLFVAAAGNDGVLIDDTYKQALCAFQEPNLLCVASSTRNNTISSGLYWESNYGKDYVHVFAPGSDIYSTIPNQQYRYKSGTSMACPHVSGLAALIRTMRPELTARQVREAIEDNVQKKEAYENLVSSGGLIDMGKTIRALKDLIDTGKTIRALKGHIETANITLDEGYWGEWGPIAKCSFPHFVHKMELKSQPKQGAILTSRWTKNGRKDGTALNGIRLTCTDGHTITSTQQMWGIWRGVKACSPRSFINKVQIRRQGRRGGRDDIGGNGVRFECTDGNQYEPGEGYWGLWSPWGSCQNGSAIMGIQTRVESDQGQGDDTALNDVRFFCAQLPQ